MQANHISTNGDEKLLVKFYTKAVKNQFLTAQEGRPVFQDVEMCEIIAPANRESKIVALAHAPWRNNMTAQGDQSITYAMRFSEQYKRFKANETQVVTGTPLSELPFLSQSQRASLRALNVLTAEQLASLEADNLKNIGMGGRVMKDQAVAYLASAKGGATTAQLAATNAELRAQLEALQQQVNAMAGGGAPADPVPAQEPEQGEPTNDDLKASIKALGGTIRGNPSRETLERMLAEYQSQKAA
jgi:hypothetical protein